MTYVDACSKPPKCPGAVPFASLVSNAFKAPAPLSIALYPPPENAIAIFGSAVIFFAVSVMYAAASKPVMLLLPRRSRIGSMV